MATVQSQRTFAADANQVAFPLGGIGTGNVSLGARGDLRDWELFNSQGKGNFLPDSFFAIRTRTADGTIAMRVLEARPQPPYTQMDVFLGQTEGLPRFEDSTMRGEYPFAWVDFEDGNLPVQVGLEAFTPFVPLSADDSGIPVAVFRYRVTNRSAKSVDVSVAGSLANAVGFRSSDPYMPLKCDGNGRNTFRDEDGLRGLMMEADGLPADHLTNGAMALVTRGTGVSAKPEWLPGLATAALNEFWDDLRDDGLLSEPDDQLERPEWETAAALADSPQPIGSLALTRRLEPGEAHDFEFFICWYFPNRERRWDDGYFVVRLEPEDPPSEGIERNHYATRFSDAWDVARYVGAEIDTLERHTREFHRAFFGSTLPPQVLDAVSANISTIRSPTCFRIEDGTLLAWEGCCYKKGAGEGSCTHVWNYAQTMAFLFPELERSMRRVEFLLETDEQGCMASRTNRVFDRPPLDLPPAADGQLGTIVRLYREWRLSGDDEFVRELWPGARRALEFALAHWDLDRDLVLDGPQLNTYDHIFYGPNSLTGPLLVAALTAASMIAAGLGEGVDAERYREMAERSASRLEELTWNGEYYEQRMHADQADRYQYGKGCLADQLFGQFLARIAGLGEILPPDRVRAAALAVYQHNFLDSLYEHQGFWRAYGVNDESGVVVCTWPHGGRPQIPMLYADEIWSGVEYVVASELVSVGLVEEGLAVVQAVRDRYDGYKRNPWSEREAGDHYARSLASWGVYAALCGLNCDLVEGRLSFEPAIRADNFSAFFVAGQAWGIYRQTIDPDSGERELDVEVLYGDLHGVRVD